MLYFADVAVLQHQSSIATRHAAVAKSVPRVGNAALAPSRGAESPQAASATPILFLIRSLKSRKYPPGSYFWGSHVLRHPPARKPRLVRVPRRSGGRPGPPSERAGAIRFLRAVPVVVAVLLCRQCGAFVA